MLSGEKKCFFHCPANGFVWEGERERNGDAVNFKSFIDFTTHCCGYFCFLCVIGLWVHIMDLLCF